MGVTNVAERRWRSDCHNGVLKEVELSHDQNKSMEWLYKYSAVDDANEHANVLMQLYILGKPGSGKTEVIMQFAIYASTLRVRVIILCPTGQLAHDYRQRLPDSSYITI